MRIKENKKVSDYYEYFEENNIYTVHDLIEYPRSIEETIEKIDIIKEIKRILNVFSKRERELLKWRYGFKDGKPKL
ncbi:MAG: hypothetical protein N2Z64_07690 [Dictyoglomus thermophilum]|nr:hypothetical protein [Dictyoglomus thermophilum]MCX7721145.1 hypothetical protein [Dictyoglomus thermophilum]